MPEHLNQQAIAKYKQSALSPTELLIADDHLADCQDCRQQIRENSNSAKLYKSFFEPLNQFAAAKSKKTFNLATAKWQLLEIRKNFHYKSFFVVGQRQFALILIAITVFAGLLMFWRKPVQPATELAAINLKEEQSISNVFEKPTLVLPDESTDSKDQNAFTEANSDKSALAVIKPNKKHLLALKGAKDSISNRPRESAIAIKISGLETDESVNLNVNSDSPNKAEVSGTLKVIKRSNTFDIDFSPVRGASEYEIYLAEMPKFITISREKLKKTRWTIPSRKLKIGRRYVLQITALNDGQEIQLTKKIINLEASLKN